MADLIRDKVRLALASITGAALLSLGAGTAVAAPPTVASVSPSAGASDVAANATVEVTLSEAMD